MTFKLLLSFISSMALSTVTVFLAICLNEVTMPDHTLMPEIYWFGFQIFGFAAGNLFLWLNLFKRKVTCTNLAVWASSAVLMLIIQICLQLWYITAKGIDGL